MSLRSHFFVGVQHGKSREFLLVWPSNQVQLGLNLEPLSEKSLLLFRGIIHSYNGVALKLGKFMAVVIITLFILLLLGRPRSS